MITINNILEVESYLNQVDGVVFDLDDTLYSEKNYVRSGYRKIAQNYPDIENAEEKLWNSFLKGEKAIDKVFDETRLDEKEKKNALNIYREHMPMIELYC